MKRTDFLRLGVPMRLKAAIALNALIVALEVWAIGNGVEQRGIGDFMYYTELSNLFGGIACALCLAGEVHALRSGRPLARGLRIAKYCASCCLLMTFFVVVLVLMPSFYAAGLDGFRLMFCVRELPITHFLGPLLVFASYVLFEADRAMTLQQSLIATVPTLAYAVVAYPCNIARLWEGPYPFFLVWEMPVWQSVLWFLALLVLSLALAQVPRLVGRLVKNEPAQ